MDNQRLNQNSDLDLGYEFSPTSRPGQLGHRQLDIRLHARPTFQHFDPENCSFWVAPDLLGNMEIQVRHPWKDALNYRVLAGRLVMVDRVGKVVEAFTFGGELNISTGPETTQCTMKSPAPIWLLDPLDPNLEIESILADEVEILIARSRETWEEEHRGKDFKLHLADVDPFGLYLGCIYAIKDKFQHFPKPVPELYVRFTHFLERESQRLQKEAHTLKGTPEIPTFLGIQNL